MTDVRKYVPSFEEMGVSVLPSMPPGTRRG
jgi:hypothetical protein